MATKRKLGFGLSLAVVAGLIALGVWWLSRDLYVVERYRIGQGREIILYGASEWDHSQPFYYEARDRDHPRMRPVEFCFTPGGYRPNVTLAVSPSGHMAAIVWNKKPWVILAIHDFRTGESVCMQPWFPSKDSNTSEALLDRFTAETPKRGYRYADSKWDKDQCVE